MNASVNLPFTATWTGPVAVPPEHGARHDAPQTIDDIENLLREAIDDPPTAVLDKLVIQIPCYNEEQTLGITLKELPRKVAGVRCVEWLVIDDGSSDRTVEVARQHGVDHIVELPQNQGLARAFIAGLNAAIGFGADVIVNTDADNQYHAGDIEKLVAPIVAGRADMVVGERPIMATPHFSPAKKILQKFGSWVVRQASSARVPDAPSGFRAMTRDTAMRLNVFTDYTYTLETLIQAGQNNMAVVSVPIRTNPDLRPSRLLRSIPGYVSRSAMTILRIFMTYRPLAFFGIPGAASCLCSLMLCARYLVFWLGGTGGGHVQSLILAAILMVGGLLGIVVGLVGDLIAVNRKLLEKIDWRVRGIESQLARPGGAAGLSQRTGSSLHGTVSTDVSADALNSSSQQTGSSLHGLCLLSPGFGGERDGVRGKNPP